MDRWVGKVAVVTGASSGIGQNIAQELAERGMTVVGVARRAELVEELAKKLSGSKGKLHALKADIGNEEDVVKAFEWIRKNIGSVHVLVNNAGIAPYTFLSKLERSDYKKIRGCFDVNVMGLIMCSNEAIKLMKEKGIDDGHIFNVNSVAGHYIGNMPGFFPYTASKFAVTVITEGLRRELAEAKSKIRVTSVSPGLVDTNIGAPSGIPNFEEMVANAPCLKSEDITRSLIHALTAPPDVQIAEIMVRPVGEQF
ncbi:farnesol dehydrogenase-like [Ischnura elegans]|uniref:farnesol dehydrogenase-like n=1 Tax=Ischnura elegans TaxID=197161 RepID=UPI001ED8A091|nr:farnesol dehydrogenase-like [Ischnura elegans]